MAKYNSYTNKKKLKIISEYRNSGNLSEVSKNNKIDRKTLREWINKEDEIRETDPNRCRLTGGGRKLKSEELDKVLYERIIDERLKRKQVTRKMIIQWATEYSNEFGYASDFKASCGWLNKFLNRNLLTLRKVNRVCSLPSDEIVSRGLIFIKHIKSLISEYRIQIENIYNMDETAIFIEEDDKTTIDTVGSDKIAVISGKISRFRITGICAASATGKKLMPTVILKAKNESIKIINGAVHLSSEKSWINSKLFIRWIEFMFPIISTPQNTILLVFDSARSHISKEVKDFLHKRKILFCVIPGGLTGLLQPADVFWFKPIKSIIRNYALNYFQSDVCQRTKAGNIKVPSNEIISSWFLNAWNNLDTETIKKSFRKCFLNDYSDLIISKDSQFSEDFIRRYLENEVIFDNNNGILGTPDSDYSVIYDE